MSVLTDFQGITDPLQKRFFSSPLLNAEGNANGDEIILATSDFRALLQEYFRLSRGIPFSLNDGVQASLDTMTGLATGLDCQVGLTCSPYRTMEANSRAADYWGADFNTDYDALASRIETVSGWLTGQTVGMILVDIEGWRTSVDDVAAMKAKHKVVYDLLAAAWPTAPIVFYGAHSVQYYSGSDTIFGNNEYYDATELLTYASVRMYEPAELFLIQQLFQKTVKLAIDKRKATYVVPMISLGWNIKRGFDQYPPSVIGTELNDPIGHEWYNTANSYQLGYMLFNPSAATAPNRFLLNSKIPFVYSYPCAWDQYVATPGSTWYMHFLKLCQGAHRLLE